MTIDSKAGLSSFQDLISKLGSQSFLSPKFLAVLVVPSAFIFSVTLGEVDTANDYWFWVVANLFSISVIALIVFVIKVLWIRFAENFIFPLLSVVAISASLGAFKGWLTAIAVIELSSGRLLLSGTSENLIGGSIAGLVGFISASAATYLFSRFKKERNLLVTARVFDQLNQKNSLEQKQLVELRERIDEFIEKLRDDEKLAPGMELSFIRQLVDETIRPLAGSMFSQIESRYSSFALRELFVKAIKSPPSAVLLASVYLLALPSHISYAGLWMGIVNCLSVSLSVFVIAKVTGWVFKGESFIGFGLVIGLSTLAGVVLNAWQGVVNVEGGFIWAAIISVLFLFANSSIVFSMAKIAYNEARANRAEITELREELQINSLALLAKQRREIANQLHGEVQSRLMSLVIKEEAGAKIDKQLAINELSQIANLLDSAPKSSKSLAESIDDTVAKWRGFAEVEVVGLDQAPESPVVAEIIDEAVYNAFRHGRANRVSISFEGKQLVIADNGIGPTDGSPGIGTQVLNSETKDWKLLPGEDGGSELRIAL